jgi:aspartate aminotransferase
MITHGTNDRHQINLNLNVRGLTPSATLAINEKSKELQAEGRKIFRLGLGQSPFPVPNSIVNELKNNAHQKDYLAVKGLLPLREAIASYYSARTGVEYVYNDVLIGPGSKELMFLIQLVYYGDLVIPTPSWVSYAPQAAIIGRNVRWLPSNREDGWRLSAEVLDEHCRNDPSRPRIVILNYPNNPAGTTYHGDELQKLAEVARRYKVIMLSDEIYAETRFDGRHVSISHYYPEGTIISGGLSKWAGAGGWRLGCFVFPEQLHWLRDAVAVAASETFTSTSAPIQYAAIKAYEKNAELQNYLLNSRRILEHIGTGMYNTLRKEAGLDIARADGGFYILPSFDGYREQLADRGIYTSSALATRLLDDAGVAVLPGSDFGLPEDLLAVRIAYVDFDGGSALQAAEYIDKNIPLPADFATNYCPRIPEATNRICNWLKG